MSAAASAWQARLALSFARRAGRTVLTGKKHSGPLLVQKPFYPEHNACCHVYLIHPPGGIVGGDDLRLSATLGKRAHALLTTPGATRFYRSGGPPARQSQSVYLEDGAILEWLPQETIYFDQANADSSTKIHIKNNNEFFAWEIQCLGLPAQRAFFNAGQCRQRLEIWRADKPLLLETNRIPGGDRLLGADWGLQGCHAFGAFVSSDYHGRIDRRQVSEIIARQQDLRAATTALNGLFIVRAMAPYAEKIRRLFKLLWQALRPRILKLEASCPRIWQT